MVTGMLFIISNVKWIRFLPSAFILYQQYSVWHGGVILIKLANLILV